MQIFDKQFVHFMWDDVLDGKEGFAADNIGLLREAVNDYSDYSRRSVCNSELDSFPFYSGLDGSRWKFFYHDPLYEYKRAYKNGKRVQFEILGCWQEVTDEWDWDDRYSYRIVEGEKKPEKSERLTYRLLALWLAKGNGQAQCDDVNAESEMLLASLNYNPVFENDIIDDRWSVRKWEDKEWHEPTLGYCFPGLSYPTPDEIGG